MNMINEHITGKQKSHIIIDASGSYLKSAVLNDDGLVDESSYCMAKSHSDDDSKEKIIGEIGICIPGPFDYRNGISLMTHKFQSLYETEFEGFDCRSYGNRSRHARCIRPRCKCGALWRTMDRQCKRFYQCGGRYVRHGIRVYTFAK